MPGIFETIVAPITGLERAAVAVVRLSGPDSWQITGKVFPLPERPVARHAYYGRFTYGDDGLVTLFQSDASYTGDESAEMSVHGSPASVQALVQACLSAGARRAEPGEFTQRAFLNGRLDLTQAEAVHETVLAETDAQLRSANLLREGALRSRVEGLVQVLFGLLASVEAVVDFSEEIGALDRSSAEQIVGGALREVELLLATAGNGRILRRGYRIALVGPPNAGKSSLLNALLGSERSIVTPVPGTTRDFVEERADFAGVPVVLTDTAGLRETEDQVEKLGVSRSREVASAADEVWYVYDGSLGWTAEDAAAAESLQATVLKNKCDLVVKDGPGKAISATTREGLAELVEGVRSRFEKVGSQGLSINDRHERELRAAHEALQLARQTLEHDQPDDLLSVSLQSAIQSLGRITGETADEDMVTRIFRDFCIGK